MQGLRNINIRTILKVIEKINSKIMISINYPLANETLIIFET